MKLGKRSAEKEVATNAPASAPARARKPASSGGKKKASGAGRFVLIIGDDGGILVYMQGNTVVRRLFAPSAQPDHTAGMVELLASHPGAPLYVLADVLDQQYVRHSFPPVSSLSVNGLVKRRLERDFQAEDLKGYLPLGRDKTGRKEWNFLLISLANTAVMQLWLDLVVEQSNELKGIYLLPVEAQNYIPALRKAVGGEAAAWELLVTHNKVSGFRQVVLKDGKLVFTRVTQAIDDGLAAVIAGNIEQEILNTIEYLRRLGFDENNKLDMFIITAQEVKETLDVNRFQAASAQVLTPMEAADYLGLQQAALSADRFGDVVVSSWFGRAKKRRLKFMTAYGEQLAKFYTISLGVKVVGVLAALALLGLSGMNVVESISANSEASTIEQQRAPLQTEAEALRKSLDGLDKDVAFKSAVVTVYDAYLKGMISPLDFVRDFAPYVDEEHRISNFEWKPQGPTEQATPALDSSGAPLPAVPLVVKVGVEFTGQYSDADALTSAANAYFDGMKANLTKYDVIIQPYPWIAGGSNSMEISFDQQNAGPAITDSANRKVEVTLRGPKTVDPAAAAAGAPALAPGGGPMGGPSMASPGMQ